MSVTATLATPTHFSISAPPGTIAGSNLNLVVEALDVNNNLSPDYSGTITFTSSDVAAVLPASFTFFGGTGSFPATLFTPGSQTITATDTSDPSLTGTSTPIAVSGPAALLEISAPLAATAGAGFTFTVTALDAFSNVVVGYTGTAHFTSSDGSANLPTDSTLTNGNGTFPATLFTPGGQTVTATDTSNPSLGGTSNPISLSAASASHFAGSAPALTTAGVGFDITVTALDPYNNVATGYTGPLHFTSSDPAAALSAYSTLTNGNGTFPATLFTPGGQTVTVDAPDPSLAGISLQIVVLPPATHFAISAPSSTTAGVGFNLSITALDQFDNIVPGYAGTVHFTSSDGSASLPANTTLANGTGTFLAVLREAGSQSITATDLADSSITGQSSVISNASGPITVNDNGDGAGVCSSTCTLRQALAAASSGDTITFAPALTSPITLTQGELLISAPLTIQGPGAKLLAISAQNKSRVFNIEAPVTITGLAIADGVVAGANGGNGASGTGNNGGPGGSAGGACLIITGSAAAVLDRVAVHHCVAIGGNGGNGGSGFAGNPYPPPGTPGGIGGNGGPGGMATGAGVKVSGGSLSLLDSSVVDAHVTGGAGGQGGDGGFGNPVGPTGTPGVGGAATGGAVSVTNGGSLRIANSTIGASSATGGAAGTYLGLAQGGNATGGLLYVDNSAALADLEFATLNSGSVAGGTGAPTGIASANAINAGSTLNVLSSIVVGAQSSVDLCSGSVTVASGSANLSEITNNTGNPSTCNAFSLHATSAQSLRPLDVTTTPWPGYIPIWRSPAIDAASTCNDLSSQAAAQDQHGTARPQGAACDLGAIEADYIFVDGFESR